MVMEDYGPLCVCDRLLMPHVLAVFLEFVPGGSIASMLKRFGKFNENLVRVYTKQILLGLEYLHRHHIMHRDIKVCCPHFSISITIPILTASLAGWKHPR